MKYLFTSLSLLLCLTMTAQKATFSAKALHTFLCEYWGVTPTELAEKKIQYLLKDIDKDGTPEVFLKYDQDITQVVSIRNGECDIIIEKSSTEERWYYTDGGHLVSHLQNDLVNNTDVFLFRRSHVSDSACSHTEKVTVKRDNGQEDHETKVEETANYKTMAPSSDKWKSIENLDGWKAL